MIRDVLKFHPGIITVRCRRIIVINSSHEICYIFTGITFHFGLFCDVWKTQLFVIKLLIERHFRDKHLSGLSTSWYEVNVTIIIKL